MNVGPLAHMVWKQERAGGELPPADGGGASPFSGVGAAAAGERRRLFHRTFRLTNSLGNEKKRCMETEQTAGEDGNHEINRKMQRPGGWDIMRNNLVMSQKESF